MVVLNVKRREALVVYWSILDPVYLNNRAPVRLIIHPEKAFVFNRRQ